MDMDIDGWIPICGQSQKHGLLARSPMRPGETKILVEGVRVCRKM